MPTFNIVKESKFKESFRIKSIKAQFDLKIDKVVEKFVGTIDIENKEWSVGLIVGSSGSGKTTIAKSLFSKDYSSQSKYSEESIIDVMPENKTTEEITKVFNSVGFATVWSWLKPYSVLSNGEKMRVDLARAILEDKDLIVFDEFTSVVDRTVAKTASFAVQKAIKKMNKKFVAVSCHYDIIEWLQPDWIYDTDKKEFFFTQKKSKDPISSFKLEKPQRKTGNYLKSIII